VPDGSYIVTLDFLDNTYDGTGTMTVLNNIVTSFHVDSNPALGSFDCGLLGCADANGDPDRAGSDTSGDFGFTIEDLSPPGNSLDLNAAGQDLAEGNVFIYSVSCTDGPCSSGTWTGRSISAPGPYTAILVIFGFSALGLGRWLKARQA
jgi:hypothetical protein